MHNILTDKKFSRSEFNEEQYYSTVINIEKRGLFSRRSYIVSDESLKDIIMPKTHEFSCMVTFTYGDEKFDVGISNSEDLSVYHIIMQATSSLPKEPKVKFIQVEVRFSCWAKEMYGSYEAYLDNKITQPPSPLPPK